MRKNRNIRFDWRRTAAMTDVPCEHLPSPRPNRAARRLVK